ncbi:D-amino-acid transaminase [Bacillus haikouensis]|jgi:D-alanine transaminase|uniref:D-amino-acid transaminase n=1 Tax=Bacillus haikouensis TaxID=1510468 RepID=UPI0015542D10|nr:D-amino-acid transaminase [Bacillus haikouensis]NQD67115.1 D-amino-acid transaminase [Bacillus haikouensis]
MTVETVFLNGEFVKRKDAKVDIEDRGYQFGDGIYEVIRVYNGEVFTMDEHMERLYQSAEKMKLKIPFEFKELSSIVFKLIEVNEVQEGSVYMQVSRGISPRQHHFPAGDVSGSVIAYTKEMKRPLKQMQEGVTAMLVEDIRWLRCDIKSLNLLGNLLAKEEAASRGHFEAIQHRGETVTEGSSSNAFIVKDGTIFTHPATNLILNGITRRVIKELADKNGVPFVEKTFTVDELLSAEEIFIASTTSEVMPVVKVDDVTIGQGVPGSLTTKLQELFSKRIKEDCKVQAV